MRERETRKKLYKEGKNEWMKERNKKGKMETRIERKKETVKEEGMRFREREK